MKVCPRCKRNFYTEEEYCLSCTEQLKDNASKRGSWYQGKYDVQNPDKYIGKTTPFYRSSWEQRYMFWCDMNPNVIRWASEPFPIPYTLNENGNYKRHNYIPDFYVEVLTKSGEIEKLVVEIKPYNQGPTKQKDGSEYVPKPPKNKNQKAMKRYYMEVKTYEKNARKWIAATSFCKSNGFIFRVLTKDDII